MNSFSLSSLHQDLWSQINPSKLLELDSLLAPHHWSHEQWKESFFSKVPSPLKLYLREEALILCSFHSQGDTTLHLLKLAISPQEQGKGKGRHLLQNLEHYARKLQLQEIYLEVSSENHQAISFYQSLGYTLLRREKNYYSDGADALKMMKYL